MFLSSALLLVAFASEPTAPAALAAPSANIVQDYRLAADDGPGKAVINLADIADGGDRARPWARVYWLMDKDPPRGMATYTKFDCAARTVVYEHVWLLNRQLADLGDGDLPGQRVPENGSTAGQVIDFVCGSAEARMQHSYLGTEWRSAIRIAAPNFR